MGKGSRPRPLSVPKQEFDKRWAETFRRTTTRENEDFYAALRAGIEDFRRMRDQVGAYKYDLTPEEQRNLLGLKQ